MTNAVERDSLVRSIVNLTGAQIFEAIIKRRGVDGCRISHTIIYCSVAEKEDILIFEDDCEIIDPTFMNLIPEFKSVCDLAYIGVNQSEIKEGNMISYGTHAMWISEHAKKCFIDYVYKTKTQEVDNIWNEVEQMYKLRVWRPLESNKYVQQKSSLSSYITGHIRSNCNINNRVI
jgi:hypothetical protein